MAARKTGARRKPRKKKSISGKKPLTGRLPFILGITALCAFFFIAGFLTRAHLTSPPESGISGTIGHKLTASKKKPKKTPRTFEIFPEESSGPASSEGKDAPKTIPSGKPSVVLIFDDMGYDRSLARKLMDLDIPLTFAILPQSRFGNEIILEARKRNVEIMLHQPMEPMEYPSVNPGPGALMSSMTPDELIEQLEQNLDALPLAVGVNNHMGSRLTTDSDRMNQVFSILKNRNLFFIDSRTSPDSVCRSSARLLRMPFAERDVFIDHNLTAEGISRQLRSLAALAVRRGIAVGIAHPHALTHDVLMGLLPELKKTVDFVPASTVVRETNALAEKKVHTSDRGHPRS